MSSIKDFISIALTVDNVIFGFDEGDLKVLLIKREFPPHIGQWSLPGYFVKQDESLEFAAIRVLEKLTGLQNVYLEQVKAFSSLHRHPLGRVITIAYYSLIKIKDYKISANFVTKWVAVSEVGQLPFDHNEILEACFDLLKSKVRHRPIGFELLPPKFTLTELQHLYEAILGRELDKRNFRKKILAMKLLEDLKEIQVGVAHRPAKLYRFDKKKYEKLFAEGDNFEFITNW